MKSRFVHRSPLGRSIARVVAAVVFALPAVMLNACGDAGPTVIDPVVTVGTTTLAGKWTGFIDGTVYGYSSIALALNADSTLSGDTSNPLYGKFTGTWTVSAGKYTSTFRDKDGITITSIAPFNKVRLVGAWTATSGKTGTFNIGKE